MSYAIATPERQTTGPITNLRSKADQLKAECEQLSGEDRIVLTWVDTTLPMNLAHNMLDGAGADRITPGLINLTKTQCRVKGMATDLDLEDILGAADWQREIIDMEGGPQTIGERSSYAALGRVVRHFHRLRYQRSN